MEEHINVFEKKSKEELLKLYEQFLEAEQTGIIPDNELGEIRDIYLKDFGSGGAFCMLQFELTHTLSDLWYKENKL